MNFTDIHNILREVASIQKRVSRLQEKTDTKLQEYQKNAAVEIAEMRQLQREDAKKADREMAEIRQSQKKTDEQFRETDEQLKKVGRLVGELGGRQKKTDDQIAKLQESQKKTDEQFRKTDEQFRKTDEQFRKTDEQFRKTDERFRETDEQLKEVGRLVGELGGRQKKTDEQFRKTDEQFRKTDKKLKDIGRLVGDLGGSQGSAAEDLFFRNTKPVFARLKKEFHDIRRNFTSRGKSEYDIVAINNKEILVMEVKNKLTAPDVDRFVYTQLPRFKVDFPKYVPYRLIGCVAGLSVKEAVEKYAERKGLYVLTQNAGTAKLANSPRFKEKVFA
uniref:DUF3782 domain-containing protein n=3 Tax=unclassified Candidatus Kentrum TaxID=2643149 RepID=A0A451B5Q0_9GAMM|nr:MAG: hypothetical protein BECKUNK1418H_GA0071006_12332 [Candidatus Kentron sp. UNK]